MANVFTLTGVKRIDGKTFGTAISVTLTTANVVAVDDYVVPTQGTNPGAPTQIIPTGVVSVVRVNAGGQNPIARVYYSTTAKATIVTAINA